MFNRNQQEACRRVDTALHFQPAVKEMERRAAQMHSPGWEDIGLTGSMCCEMKITWGCTPSCSRTGLKMRAPPMPRSPAVKPANAITATTIPSFLYGFFLVPALAFPLIWPGHIVIQPTLSLRNAQIISTSLSIGRQAVHVLIRQNHKQHVNMHGIRVCMCSIGPALFTFRFQVQEFCRQTLDDDCKALSYRVLDGTCVAIIVFPASQHDYAQLRVHVS